jgi:hypothetical protein
LLIIKTEFDAHDPEIAQKEKFKHHAAPLRTQFSLARADRSTTSRTRSHIDQSNLAMDAKSESRQWMDCTEFLGAPA